MRIDYGNGYYPDYRKVWYGAVHKECIAEIDRLKGILARVNALNDEIIEALAANNHNVIRTARALYFRKEIDDLTIEFSSASTVTPEHD